MQSHRELSCGYYVARANVISCHFKCMSMSLYESVVMAFMGAGGGCNTIARW